MILHKNKQKAFTIVELLIVIVVIGILAAISIVAYNGIQNRARDTSVADSAKQVRSKIETWNSIQGAYPTAAELKPASGVGLRDDDAQEARLTQDLTDQITTSAGSIATAHGTGTPIAVTLCDNGANIQYYQSGGNTTITAGSGC